MQPDRDQLQVVAVELAALAVDIEAIASELCTDPAVVAAHGMSLQSIDLIGQRQRALADLLAAADFNHALAECRLDRIAALFGRQAA